MVPIFPQAQLSFASATVGQSNGVWEITYNTDDSANVGPLYDANGYTAISELDPASSTNTWYDYSPLEAGHQELDFECNIKFENGGRKHIYLYLDNDPSQYFLLQYENGDVFSYTTDNWVKQSQNMDYSYNTWLSFQLELIQTSSTTKLLTVTLGTDSFSIELDSDSTVDALKMRTMTAGSSVFFSDVEVSYLEESWQRIYPAESSASAIPLNDETDDGQLYSDIYELEMDVGLNTWYEYTKSGIEYNFLHFDCNLKFLDGGARKWYFYFDDGAYFIINFENQWIRSYVSNADVPNWVSQRSYGYGDWNHIEFDIVQKNSVTKELKMSINGLPFTYPVLMSSGFNVKIEYLRVRLQTSGSLLISDMAVDNDQDGLDEVEEAMLGSDPLLKDTDGDFAYDGEEASIYGTDPTVPDEANGFTLIYPEGGPGRVDISTDSSTGSKIYQLNSEGSSNTWFQHRLNGLRAQSVGFHCKIKVHDSQEKYLYFYFDDGDYFIVRFINLHLYTTYIHNGVGNGWRDQYIYYGDQDWLDLSITITGGPNIKTLDGSLDGNPFDDSEFMYSKGVFDKLKTRQTGTDNLWSFTEFMIDSDLDELSDVEELDLGTDPTDADSDGDGLTDGEEVNNHGTNPLVADSDGDKFSDLLEIRGKLNPMDPSDVFTDECTLGGYVPSEWVIPSSDVGIQAIPNDWDDTSYLSDNFMLSISPTYRHDSRSIEIPLQQLDVMENFAFSCYVGQNWLGGEESWQIYIKDTSGKGFALNYKGDQFYISDTTLLSFSSDIIQVPNPNKIMHEMRITLKFVGDHTDIFLYFADTSMGNYSIEMGKMLSKIIVTRTTTFNTPEIPSFGFDNFKIIQWKWPYYKLMETYPSNEGRDGHLTINNVQKGVGKGPGFYEIMSSVDFDRNWNDDGLEGMHLDGSFCDTGSFNFVSHAKLFDIFGTGITQPQSSITKMELDLKINGPDGPIDLSTANGISNLIDPYLINMIENLDTITDLNEVTEILEGVGTLYQVTEQLLDMYDTVPESLQDVLGPISLVMDLVGFYSEENTPHPEWTCDTLDNDPYTYQVKYDFDFVSGVSWGSTNFAMGFNLNFYEVIEHLEETMDIGDRYTFTITQRTFLTGISYNWIFGRWEESTEIMVEDTFKFELTSTDSF
ncbi:hypothetical protein NEF87_002777 [Candidatus Lokiarchaeum ossiferum]|uniref:Uncharacterized protein n=1 Tax=Candidatus Lokiarchaeum ossiferum TaxID=2951803 RepID=A0ABY6HVV3_9ARCH|nr:hypothetical protein NEF87_002777 [Candidatus Lokiarchaeum sp. B-35]